jgi:hypothetical protein
MIEIIKDDTELCHGLIDRVATFAIQDCGGEYQHIAANAKPSPP